MNERIGWMVGRYVVYSHILKYIDGKIRHLHHLLNGKSTTQDFKKGLEEMSDLNMEIRSMVERDTSPLRRG